LYGRKGSVAWPSGIYSSAANGVLFDTTIQPRNTAPAHTEEILAFAQAIRARASSPVPVEETIKVIAILEGIMRSSERGGREIAVKL
jgi:predicted dehydrogenase